MVHPTGYNATDKASGHLLEIVRMFILLHSNKSIETYPFRLKILGSFSEVIQNWSLFLLKPFLA